ASTSNWDWSVVGIGINLNQTFFSPNLPNPVSLKQITGKDVNTVQLAKDLCTELNSYFTKLTQNGFNEIYQLYNERIYKLNEPVKLKKKNALFQTTVKGVSKTGELITHNGKLEERFAFGEISWLL